jgi:hypothetical protein
MPGDSGELAFDNAGRTVAAQFHNHFRAANGGQMPRQVLWRPSVRRVAIGRRKVSGNRGCVVAIAPADESVREKAVNFMARQSFFAGKRSKEPNEIGRQAGAGIPSIGESPSIH